MAVWSFYQAQPATHDGLPGLHENDEIFFPAIYSQYGAVMKGVPFFNYRYTKGLRFLSKWYTNVYGVKPRDEASSYNNL